MKTKIATALASGTAEQAGARLVSEARAKLQGESPALLLAFASTAQPLEGLMRTLAAEFPAATCLGASTAGEFTEEGDAKGSAALFALAGEYKVFAGMSTGLKADPERAIGEALEGLPRQLHAYPHRTALLLLDPLAGNGEEATLLAASLLGDGVRLAGGAAGDDLAMKATHVALGRRAGSDAVVVALLFSKQPLGVGVCHGHEPISAPLRVTRASGAVVHEIEGRPAWQVWRAETAARVPDVASEDEGAFLLRYEAGLAAGQSYKIRAPLSRGADDSISFACGIPQGSVIRITESQPERQVASAREAARRARSQLGALRPAGALVFDCICRNLILQKDFGRALRGMTEELGGVPLAGFETYGEIALDAGDMSGFHNTTSVVLAFPE
ncbi:MAG TPA: FIST N-terminal domain-containing protein [Polyangiaceae bacterium]|nr:FIST N-terminal domain-containing protein [Polyangiaceae bacterium]